MEDSEWLAGRFEEHRPHLRGVAYRMLGSLSEADDALQNAWLRINGAGTDGVKNVEAWLTTIVARVSLNMLRFRNTHPERTSEALVPDPIVSIDEGLGPEQEVLLADSVGLALQIVIDTLTPPERLAFVLHDMFDLPFNEIAPMLGRSPQATRQLASRGRRRVKGAQLHDPEPDVGRQREVVDAFFAAGRAGDFDALVAVLHPDVVARADFSPAQPEKSTVVRGAQAVADQARLGAALATEIQSVLLNYAAGAVISVAGRPFAIMAFTVAENKIIEINTIRDPDRVARLVAPVRTSAGQSGLARLGGTSSSHDQ